MENMKQQGPMDQKISYDLLLVGGTVIDPLLGSHRNLDIGVIGERVAATGIKLPRGKKTRVIDCKGLTIVPGLIDMHVHVFINGGKELGIDADSIMKTGGVTTLVDAGSAGSENWSQFKRDIIQPAQVRVLSLIHLCRTGLYDLHELLDPKKSDPEGAVRVIRQDPAQVRGVKLRAGEKIIGTGQDGWDRLKEAIHVARETETFVMIHIGDSPMTLTEMVSCMSPGDMITHCYKGDSYFNKVLNDDGRVFPELLEAQRKGILFDVGHGNGSFEWTVAEKAIDQGLLPNIISTDLHAHSLVRAVFNMPMTMTKFLMLGFSLKEVVRLCTLAPAKALGLDNQIGSLMPGYAADITILGWKPGYIDLYDSYDNKRTNDGVLYAAGVIKGGVVVRDPLEKETQAK